MVDSKGAFDFQAPTALLIGRWQPFHAGHLALATEAARRHGQLAIGVRDTHGTPGNPFPYPEVVRRITAALAEFPHPFTVFQVPNITGICYGRDVGYSVERIGLAPELEAVSGTAIRQEMGV